MTHSLIRSPWAQARGDAGHRFSVCGVLSH
jgi:hypothetical protein